MKHCAKKLLGLAFALALCLAVGGTALAQTPEFADVPAALPEQEMLAYEPNVTTAAGNTAGSIETDGYTVTIPTTVTVDSGTNEETLMVTADVRQLRILTITLDSANNWQLKHESGQAQAGYSLKAENPNNYEELPSKKGWWMYNEEGTDLKTKKPELYLSVAQKAEGDFDINWFEKFTVPLTVKVTDPSQATMSGTYSDTVSFTFGLAKQCVTYTVNVYEQKLQLAADGKSVEAVDMVDEHGNVQAGAKPVRTEILEYPTGKDENKPWDYTGDEPDAALRWEKATATMNTHQDVNGMTSNKVDANNNVTINLNRRYKWYWLDVNGATDYTNEFVGGNQGDHIGSCVEIMLSVDGDNWTDWFWHGEYGDDYWANLPYGVYFKLGFHHVKNGYVYDTGTGTLKENGVRIIANKEEKYTATGEPVGGSTYYVYTGQMTGAPTGTDGYNNVCYCYIPCYKKGLTYIANGGTGGTESVNTGNPPRSNVLYEDGGTLKSPEDLNITAPTGKSFAGWSTKPTYTTGDKLYKVGDPVSSVKWETYTDTSKRPELNGKIDDEKRELYAIWGYDITVQFEDETGYSTNDGSGPVATLGNPMSGCSFTLEAQVVTDGADWTLDLTNSTVEAKIIAASNAAKSVAGDDDTKIEMALAKKIWKIGKYTEDGHDYDFTKECTLSAEDVKKGKPLVIQRRRYLLSVISADIDTISVNAIATKADEDKFGKFNVTIDGISGLGVTQESHCQVGLNYGAKYTVSEMTGIGLYSPMGTKGAVVLKSLKAGDKIDSSWFTNGLVVIGQSYTGYMTGKQTDVHYYTSAGALAGDGYTGDPVRVAFNDSSTTGSDTPAAGPSLAPAKKALTLRYHANFDPNEELALDLDPDPLLEDMDDTFGFDPDPLPEDVDDALEEAVKTVRYQPGEDVVLRNCMFKRGGYVFVGWNTEPDGTGKKYEVNGVPITDWAAGDTVDLYAQWKKPEHLKPVVDSEPFVPADPDTPPERIDDGFDADFGADPDPLPEGMDDAFGADPDPLPKGMDDAFGVDPAAQPEALDDAFGV